jgi:predicted kinase
MSSKSFTSPLFILMHGLPAAGKSSFARQYAAASRMAHINSDRIRFELYDDAQFSSSENRMVLRLSVYMAEMLLGQSQPLIFDMNLPSQAMRNEVKSLARRYGYNFVVVWVQTNEEEAMRRAGARDRRRPDDKYSPAIGPQLFERVASKSGQPNPERETVAVISGQQSFAQQQRLADHRLLSLGFIAGGSLAPKGGRVDLGRRQAANNFYGRNRS